MKFNFFVFLLLSLLVIGLSQTALVSGVGGVFADIVSPLKTGIFGVFNRSNNTSQIKKIEEENRTLKKQLVDLRLAVLDMQALKDQFAVVYPKSQNLLLANIVGAPRFIPGITQPSRFIVNRGKKDGVRVGQAVAVGDNLLGKIVEVSESLAKVDIVTNSSFSLTAKTSKSGAIGVIKGKGNGEMILDNVLLSENLQVGDFVVTRGDLDVRGVGIPSRLIIGEIISVDKKPSALFQTADVKSLLSFASLSIVYITLESEQ